MECKACNQPMRHDVQPALMSGRVPLHLYTCNTVGCLLEHVTLTSAHHAALTAADVAGYARAKRRMEARAL